MMRKILLLSLVAILVSCTNDRDLVNPSDMNHETVRTNKVSLDEALKRADKFFAVLQRWWMPK